MTTVTPVTLNAVVYLIGSLGLLVLDGLFSFYAWRGLKQVVDEVQAAMPPTTVGKVGAAVNIAKINLGLVILSVVSTSIHYCVFSFFLIWWGIAPDQFGEVRLFSFVMPTWCVDSILNDLCAVYIGCGPTQAAVELMSRATQATVIGRAVPGPNGNISVAAEGNAMSAELSNSAAGSVVTAGKFKS